MSVDDEAMLDVLVQTVYELLMCVLGLHLFLGLLVWSVVRERGKVKGVDSSLKEDDLCASVV